ncbi:signal peptidase I [Actinokineospora terrae]|uniref:Signal peptidase I n=1 Tax=Actinokineospora terrae TaxID=155974 RepID=A0A1H9QE36_9PSEU|nr:signal peptidase I [Actinokineospora terrae]SER58688.1 signal peptidase I [Actinokineospora terrae]
MGIRVWRVVGVVTGVLGAFVVAAVVAVAVLAIPITGGSMEPTFHDGDRVLPHPFLGPDDVERGDVVATRFSADGPLVVKRVIAVAGDRVRIDPGPVVRVLPAGESEWRAIPTAADWGAKPVECCGPDGKAAPVAADALVPAGKLFLLGDNPGGSDDSRASGWAPRDLVRAIVWTTVWPIGG